ncbi:hypothetical protein ACWGB8_06585 [Kitasatospora sp. NPDC054939]
MTALQTDDAAAGRILATLDAHMSSMERAANHVRDIKTEIQANFAAVCSSTYQQRVAAWEDAFGQLQRSYSEFQIRLTTGNQMINNAHEEAVALSTAGGPGDDVFHALNVNIPR